MEKEHKIVSKTNFQEEQSILKFELLVSPSQCLKPRQDTGIDLIVVPYIPENEGSNNYIPFPYVFAVQLKSTANEVVNQENATFQIEKAHIKQWLAYNIPVLLARYYVKEDKFLCAWIDDTWVETNIIQLQNFDNQVVINFIRNYSSIKKQDWADELSRVEWQELQKSLEESEQADQLIENSEALNHLKQQLS